MDLEDQNPLFPYTKEDKLGIYKELNLDEKIVKEGVESITDWFNKQPHLANADFDPHFFEKLIIISKGSIERAKQRLDGLYKYRCLAPEFIQERDILRDPEKKLWDVCAMFPIAKMQNSRRIHFMKFAEDLGMFDITDLFRNAFMYVDIRMRYDYWLGDIWVLDFKHISLSHIFTLKPTVLRKAALLFQNGLNWRIQSIHIINLMGSMSLANRVMDFLKQFFSALIMSRVVIYEKPEDLQKLIPEEYLPEDYGGTAPNSTILTEKVEKEFKRLETIDFLLNCRKYISDESRRPEDEYSEENLPGSFRQLEFD